MKKRGILMLCMAFCLVTALAGCSLTRENPNLAESKLVKEAKQYEPRLIHGDFHIYNVLLGSKIEIIERISFISKTKVISNYGRI